MRRQHVHKGIIRSKKDLSNYDLLYKSLWYMAKMLHDLGIAVGALHEGEDFMHCNNQACHLVADILNRTKR